jgi:hypothetical protein
MKTGIELIAQERKEQVKKHGFTTQHDQDTHYEGELLAAANFAITYNDSILPSGFEEFKSKMGYKNKVQRLAVAGALIAAEIDRLNSLKP